MTTEALIQVLRASGADGWELTVTQKTAWEFYFIRHTLDQHRVRDVEYQEVQVYRRFGGGKYLGSAGGEIPPTAAKAEAEAAVQRFLQAAAYVRNPAYTLNPPRELPPCPEETPDLAAIARSFMEVMRSLPETQTEDVNSYELFVSADRVRFLNSEGIDYIHISPSSMLEVVLNARSGGREIELYRMITGGGCDGESLRKRLSEALALGRDKLKAAPTPALRQADVIFSTDAALELYEYFVTRMDAAHKYRGYSDWEAGKPVAAYRAGDRVTVKTLVSLPGASETAPFDEEGAPIREVTLIQDGIAQRFAGSRQFSQYLGLEESFIPGCVAFSGGTATAEELYAGQYLDIREFSDFQVDPVNGEIAGEIRLAYWHDGEKTVPVSGGSVSGSMKDFIPDMRMSAEQQQYDTRLIPKVTRLYGVRITGAEPEEKA